ncbi:hypothetical protein BDW66DRAFT_163373 [Aspergillus desertorum]
MTGVWDEWRGITLEGEADYGRLPFDIFLSDLWDHNATRDSREEWERLVWEWESLTLMERYPYQQRAQSEAAPPELSEEIKRVLATHQTAHERNISLVSCDYCQPIWLRTCYDSGLAEKYEQMKWESEDFRGVSDMDGDGSNIQNISGRDEEMLRIQVALYVLDREAIESGLIKILWLDEHGQICLGKPVGSFHLSFE